MVNCVYLSQNSNSLSSVAEVAAYEPNLKNTVRYTFGYSLIDEMMLL